MTPEEFNNRHVCLTCVYRGVTPHQSWCISNTYSPENYCLGENLSNWYPSFGKNDKSRNIKYCKNFKEKTT